MAGVPERESEDKPRSQMTFGDRVTGLEAITVVSRMPKHKKDQRITNEGRKSFDSRLALPCL